MDISENYCLIEIELAEWSLKCNEFCLIKEAAALSPVFMSLTLCLFAEP